MTETYYGLAVSMKTDTQKPASVVSFAIFQSSWPVSFLLNDLRPAKQNSSASLLKELPRNSHSRS